MGAELLTAVIVSRTHSTKLGPKVGLIYERKEGEKLKERKKEKKEQPRVTLSGIRIV